MKTGKLVVGILSCVLFIFIVLQSCAAGAAEVLGGSDGGSGSAGLLTAFCMLAAGIVSIATHNTIHGRGSIAAAVFYALAGVIGICLHGIYEDLIIWGALCLIFAVLEIIFYSKGKTSTPA